MRIALLMVILNLFFGFSVWAETSLWVVKTEHSLTYIGGTSHVLRPVDYPLPDAFEAAYENSDSIVLEADPAQIASPELQQLMLQKSIYQGGLSLDRVLAPETYNLLRQYCEDAGIPLANLNKFKPSMLALVLVSLELQKLGSAQSGVDFYFYNKAITDGKFIDELETAEQQVGFLLSMGEGNEDQFIRHTITDLKNTREFFERFILAWRNGDEPEMETLLIDEMKEKTPDIYESLFLDRNEAWLPKLEGYIESGGTEFILVGVAHLVGEDGLIRALKNRGYDVEKMH